MSNLIITIDCLSTQNQTIAYFLLIYINPRLKINPVPAKINCAMPGYSIFILKVDAGNNAELTRFASVKGFQA